MMVKFLSLLCYILVIIFIVRYIIDILYQRKQINDNQRYVINYDIKN